MFTATIFSIPTNTVIYLVAPKELLLYVTESLKSSNKKYSLWPDSEVFHAPSTDWEKPAENYALRVQR